MRKYVLAFGDMFNHIQLVRLAPNSTTEEERIVVPLQYAPKEKYITRLQQDPDLLKTIALTLPRMSFEVTSINYDATRQQNALLPVAKGNTTTAAKTQYMGVPYDINFDLNVYTRNIDDANQIIEQMLPSFSPDFTLTINPIPEMGYTKDIPIILESISQDIQYEGGWDSVRYVYHTLKFSVKGYFWGPISTPKIIRKSIANIYNDPSLVTGYVIRINTGTGNGNFQIQDTVYQGKTYETADAFGIVIDWNKQNNKLLIGGAQGQFYTNTIIKAATTNATYNIASFDATPLKLVKITVEPDPITAQPGDDYGYYEKVIEFPDTMTPANT